MVAVIVPSGKFVAVALIVTDRFVLELLLSVPLEGERMSQLFVLPSVQVRELVPEFDSVKVAGFGVNGPPTGPVEDNTAGLICKVSGTSYASTNPVVVEFAGEVALAPIPRLANAAHSKA